MSDIAEEFYEDDDQPNESNPVRARMKQLEKENREFRKQLAEAETAKKELAFVKAGVDPTDPKAKWFVKGYDGEFSPEAIRAAAEEAQIVTPQQQVTDSDKQAWQTSNKVAAGAESGSEGPSWIKRIQDAQSEDELMAVFAEAQAQGIDLSTTD
jgi:hypothetical protein